MMKKNVYILLFLLLAGISCSKDKPMLKKELSECSVRDLLEYGRALFNAEYYKDAIQEYRKVISLFPNAKSECAWAQYELAYSYYYLEEYKEAMREFRKVNMLYPDERGPVILAEKMIKKISVL
ncbi:MAG: hypothetical protein PHF84_05475 [bacterium]|nr:hypothetical protein [bacterium]